MATKNAEKKYRSINDPSFKVTVKTGKGRTKQSFKDECNINNIMKKFQTTGQLPEMIKSNPRYGDFSEPLTYQEAQNVVVMANEQFANLSAKVRERFGNDPQKFLEFCHDPENGIEMVKLGLAKKRPTADKGSASNNEKSAPKEEPKVEPKK